jgi:amino acid transporter
MADASSVSTKSTNSDENADSAIVDDDILLESMGYKKELYRGLDAFANFAFGFTEVAVLPSFISLYTFGLETGGPAVIAWGFLVTFAMTMIVSLSMAEICSAYPSAGSVYHWSAQVVPERYSALWSYITGWFNYLGNSAGDAAFAFSFAQQLNAAIKVSGGSAYSPQETVGVAIAITLVWSLCNIFRVDQVGFLSNWAAFSQCAVVLILLVAVLAVPNELATTHYVFTTFYNSTGFENKSYVVCLGLLTSIFSFTGYEASAHMAEETTNSRIVAPRGIIMTCLATGLCGLLLILGMLYSTPDVEYILQGPTESAAVNVFLLQCGSKWAQALSWLVVYVLFFAGVSSVAVTGRITYALMRDKAFPHSDFWAQVHPTLHTPINAIMFVCIFDFLLLLVPLAGDNGTTAFASITGLTSIGFQISYALPIALKLYYQPSNFPLTPFHLGVWSRPLGILSCLWLFSTSCFFFFPEEAPVTPQSMNWVIVVVAACFIFAAVNWYFNSQYTFHGPPRHKEEAVVAHLHHHHHHHGMLEATSKNPTEADTRNPMIDTQQW